LFLKHRNGRYGFAKGLIEEKETPQAAAEREIKEETGIDGVKIVPGFKEVEKYFFKVKYDYQLSRGWKMGEGVLKFVTYFLAQAPNKKVKISFEHEGYEWLDFEAAIERLKKYKNSQQILTKANKFLKNHD